MSALRPGLLPPPPRPGARVAVVAPSGPMLLDRLEAGLAPLREARFDVVTLGPMRTEGTSEPFLAGPDARRAEATLAALREPDVEAIVCVRGGYGAMRLLRALDAALDEARVPPRPVRLCGFSDVTALHAWAFSRLGWASLHAPMPFNFATASGSPISDAQRDSARRFIDALVAPEPGGTLAEPAPLTPVVGGAARGVLLGGNLTLVAHIYRTPALPSLEGALLFLEDVGEKPYALDRLITALELRGAAEEVAGVVLGGFTRCGELRAGAAAAFVARRLERWGVPVVRGFDAGHLERNRSFWLGLEYELDADAGALCLVKGGEA